MLTTLSVNLQIAKEAFEFEHQPMIFQCAITEDRSRITVKLNGGRQHLASPPRSSFRPLLRSVGLLAATEDWANVERLHLAPPASLRYSHHDALN